MTADSTWQEALMLLHERGWSGELVDDAIMALVECCESGALEGREVGSLSAAETRRVLEEPCSDAEGRALCLVAAVHDRADAEGERLRGALRDLDAFADALGED